MTKNFPSVENDWTKVHVFRPDWHHVGSSHLRFLYGCLAVILVVIYKTLKDTPPSTEAMISIVVIFAMVAGSTFAAIYRIRKNAVVLTVGPDGVSFPAVGISKIDWTDVERVKVVRLGTRHMDIKAVRFYFTKGRLQRRQFGNLFKDRWEVILSVRTWPLGGKTWRIVGGEDALMSSIRRFAVIG